METRKRMALCPDGIDWRYTVVDGDAPVRDAWRSTVNGTVVEGKFRPHARHHGAVITALSSRRVITALTTCGTPATLFHDSSTSTRSTP